MLAVTSLVVWVGVTSAVNTRHVQLRMKCSEQMKRVGAALLEYAKDIPQDQNALHWLVSSGMVNEQDTRCPSTDGMEYFVPAANGRVPGAPEHPFLIAEPGSNHRDGANAFLRNGDCKFIRKAQFKELAIPEM